MERATSPFWYSWSASFLSVPTVGRNGGMGFPWRAIFSKLASAASLRSKCSQNSGFL